jgi:hypothetical protein
MQDIIQKLRIGLDARTFGGAMTGIGNYAYHTIQSACEIDPSLEFLGYKRFSLRKLDESFFQALPSSADKHSSTVLPAFFGQAESRVVCKH